MGRICSGFVEKAATESAYETFEVCAKAGNCIKKQEVSCFPPANLLFAMAIFSILILQHQKACFVLDNAGYRIIQLIKISTRQLHLPVFI